MSKLEFEDVEEVDEEDNDIATEVVTILVDCLRMCADKLEALLQ